MPAKPRERSEGNLYHVYTRAVARVLLFEDDADRESFLVMLNRNRQKHKGILLAWCLMGNHYHLLVRMELESLSELMRVTNLMYAQHFNMRYDRRGHLFQGRYGSQAVTSDEQLLCALRYVHRNPVEAGIGMVDEYPWSSYGDYLGRPSSLCACDTGFMLGMFGGLDEFVRFHEVPGDGGFSFIDTNVSPSKTRPMSDSRAIKVVSSIIGDDWRDVLPYESKPLRNLHLRMLREVGLSVNQIERLTGISRGIVSTACKACKETVSLDIAGQEPAERETPGLRLDST